ncbi:MAG: hypothetical protein A2W31_10090 [Planctomycetes bacterium RBG_16_64_10]|nr:MAG: hypothetical protein A2W31_10090 [Planctomycetes bacterium RBG_16_64_10]
MLATTPPAVKGCQKSFAAAASTNLWSVPGASHKRLLPPVRGRHSSSRCRPGTNDAIICEVVDCAPPSSQPATTKAAERANRMDCCPAKDRAGQRVVFLRVTLR